MVFPLTLPSPPRSREKCVNYLLVAEMLDHVNSCDSVRLGPIDQMDVIRPDAEQYFIC